jgi:hypothetical protein
MSAFLRMSLNNFMRKRLWFKMMMDLGSRRIGLVWIFTLIIIEEDIGYNENDCDIVAPEISIDVNREDDGEFYPFQNRLEFLLSVAFEGNGQDCMSEPIQKLILKLLKDVGVNGVPSLSTIKSLFAFLTIVGRMKSLQLKYNCVPKKLETPQGHLIWYNPLDQVIAMETSIPEVWEKLHSKHVDTSASSELFHGEKWRSYADVQKVGLNPDERHGKGMRLLTQCS